jgi:glutathione synthase/RimK-type ligase-like ATP-grasp enzyme
MSGKEKGYIYFQDFIPNNDYDTRLTVIGNKCTAVRRYNRTNDFRASGSGIYKFEPELFDIQSIQLAFDLAEKLKMQSCAFDFIKHKDKDLLVEISYCFPVIRPSNIQGYWDRELNWHPGKLIQEYFMIEDLINTIVADKD